MGHKLILSGQGPQGAGGEACCARMQSLPDGAGAAACESAARSTVQAKRGAQGGVYTSVKSAHAQSGAAALVAHSEGIQAVLGQLERKQVLWLPLEAQMGEVQRHEQMQQRQVATSHHAGTIWRRQPCVNDLEKELDEKCMGQSEAALDKAEREEVPRLHGQIERFSKPSISNDVCMCAGVDVICLE